MPGMLFGLICCLSLSGCGYSQGELLYVLGFGKGQAIQAKFRLAEGPVMILIDDPDEQVDWPLTKRYLFDDLAQELLKNEAAKKIIPLATVEQLRQSIPNFLKRGCREIGQRAGAEQVLWVEVDGFLAAPDFEDAGIAAYFNIRVKVINVLEQERRSRVRLWPISPGGHSVSGTMSGSEVAMAKKKDAIARELAGRLAANVAKLFYDHRLGDFEREQ